MPEDLPTPKKSLKELEYRSKYMDLSTEEIDILQENKK